MKWKCLWSDQERNIARSVLQSLIRGGKKGLEKVDTGIPTVSANQTSIGPISAVEEKCNMVGKHKSITKVIVRRCDRQSRSEDVTEGQGQKM